MRDNILFAALGLGAGALIASIALGVVLIYRGSGIINVATGAIAMVAAYIFWALRTDYFGFTLSTVPAFALTLVCMAASASSSSWRSSAAPEHGAARQAGRVARPPARPGGRNDRDLRQHPEVGARGPAFRHGHGLRPRRAEDRFLPGDRDRRRGALAALYRWTPSDCRRGRRRTRSRRCSPACRRAAWRS